MSDHSLIEQLSCMNTADATISLGQKFCDMHTLFGYSEWIELVEMVETNIALKVQFDKLLNLYYIVKTERNNK